MNTARSTPCPRHRRQRGVTLLELLVGLVIGLLTVAVSMGALMVSRGVSGTVSDASEIQQQGAYAMRVIGQQVRQAGSLRLDLYPATALAAASEGTTGSEDLSYLLPVALETQAEPDPSVTGDKGWNPATDTIGSQNGSLAVGFANYPEETTTGSESQAANCLGGSQGAAIRSSFRLQGSELQCSDTINPFQPIVRNVAAFQVRYLLQDNASTPGIPQISYVTSPADIDAIPNGWARVQALEVCLELFGNEPIDLPANSQYTGCTGPVQYSTLTGPRARRMHLTLRNIFQLRSQGLAGAVL